MNFIDGIHSFVATNGVNFVFSAICALIFVLVGFKVSGMIVKMFKRGKGFRRLNESVSGFVVSAIGVSLKILTVVIAATIVGINATALSAVLWLGMYALVESDWISFRSGWFALPER